MHFNSPYINIVMLNDNRIVYGMFLATVLIQRNSDAILMSDRKTVSCATGQSVNKLSQTPPDMIYDY